MNDVKKFVAQWSARGFEKGEAQSFWLSLLRDVFNVDEPEKFISFEVTIPHGFIDGLIVSTKTLIEQKSSTVNLDNEEIFQQAKRYNDALEYSRKARWIVTCNFREFRIYDMDRRKPELNPLIISLSELPEKFHLLEFLVDQSKNKLRVELELSLQASEIVAKIYDALLTQYVNPNSAESLASLNKLCVRLVFCLYAESAGIFGKHKIFRDYLEGARNIRRDLLELFEVLNTPIEERDPYLDDALKNFPYVNGGLFDDAIEIPNFTPEIKELLLEEASSGFNWSGISPTIFGAVFESTLNPETRRLGGMHYTSIENIHKVIDPLFMEDLRGEFKALKTKKQLRAFHEKIAAIKIFDPACGSGNFLTESYLSLRLLENEILEELRPLIALPDNPIKVSINQFFGIEINSFAVAVAQTALWIAENQMLQQTEGALGKNLQALPLKSYATIVCGNALKMNWHDLFKIPNSSFHIPNYVFGNPPFVGKSFQTREQKSDMAEIFAGVKGYGNLDYVACWFKKAADFIHGTKTSCAFVATNSISQGIAVPPLWTYLFGKGVKINFAHQTFKWTSESSDIAAVHCVIVGFADFDAPVKKIFDCNGVRVVQNINAYLLDAPNVIVLPRALPLRDDVPIMSVGANPTDGGNLILSPAERDELIAKNPLAEKYIHPFVSGEDFIHGKRRYCLLLVNCPPNELRKMPRVMKRVEGVRDFRLASKSIEIRRYAKVPTLFARTRYVDSPKLVIPRTSAASRRYIPMGFAEPNVVVSDGGIFIADCSLYIFGVLMSSIHMAWMRVTAGRFGVGYRYGRDTVYNTFPFCESTAAQKKLIETTAQAILDVRSKYPDATLADLYDELAMPRDLRDAHHKNDLAVARLYGFENILDNESAIASELLKMYAALTS